MASGFIVLCGNLFLQPQECQNYSRIGLQLLVYIYVGACISETTCSSDLVFTYVSRTRKKGILGHFADI